MDELILFLTAGNPVLDTMFLVRLLALVVILEAVSVAIGHMASLGRS